jgi:hypothetical protein
MPALARDFEVISVDQRGIGLSDKPQDGYDSGTLAGDLVALMAALGHSVSAPSSHHAAQLRPSKASADPPASSSCSKIAQASCHEPPESAVHPSLRLFTSAAMSMHRSIRRIRGGGVTVCLSSA